MNKILIISLVLLAACGPNEVPNEVPSKDLVERNGIKYEVFSKVPFTGSFVSYNYNGQLHIKENYKDGNRDGLFESYYKNGQFKQDYCFKNNEKVDMSYCDSNLDSGQLKRVKLQRLLAESERAQKIPVYVPQPQYPRRAQTRGKEGYAVISLIITSTGGVRDPVMIEEFPEGWGFGRAAVKAALKLKYNPRVVDGVSQEVTDVLYEFTFQMTK
jgi:TonB family protein